MRKSKAMASLVALGLAALTSSGGDRGMRVEPACQTGVPDYDPKRFHALIIGIDDYRHWPALRSAVADAKAVAEVLERRYGFGDVKLLLDGNATRKDILRALDDYVSLGADDSLLIYFAGHGWMDSRSGNGYWIPVDAREKDKFDYIANNRIVGDYFKKYKVRHLLVVADSCFSGSMLRGGGFNRGEKWKIPSGFRKPSRWIMTSGDLAPVPDGVGGHSPFATRFLQYLRFSDNPVFGIYDLYSYVRDNLDQEPIAQPLKSDSHMPGGEFIFCRLSERPCRKPPPTATVPRVAAPKPIVENGSILLESQMNGELSLDGRRLCQVQPGFRYPIDDVPAGSRDVEVVGAFGKGWRRRVTVEPGRELTLVAKPTPRMANAEFYAADAEPGGRMISVIYDEPANLNFLTNNVTLVSTLWSFANDSLAERNYQRPEIFQPQLAEHWSLSEDKKVYSIKLKEGVLWHDFTDPVTGKEWRDVEVTAADFKFHVDVIKNEDVDCAATRVYLKDLERVEIVSKYEFKVHWKKRYFLTESVTLGLSPLPRHLYHSYDGPFDGGKFNEDAHRNRLIVGCGPYRLEKWETGREIVLSKWRRYYGKEYGVEPPLDTFVFRVFKHSDAALRELVNGDVDELGLTPDAWLDVADTPAFNPETGSIRRIKYPARSYNYIGYNEKNPLFEDKLVRRAMTCLVDRERILKEIYHGLGVVVTGNFFIDSPYYDDSVKPYPFSVAKAKELLLKAGWIDTDGDGVLDKNGAKFEFAMLMVAGHGLYNRMLPIIKEDMAKAGVVMNVKPVAWAQLVRLVNQKSYDACVLGWALSMESDPYQIWHSGQADVQGSSNHVGFKNKQADDLIEKIRVCFDLRKRIQLCHDFHRLLHEEQPYTFLITPDRLLGLSSRYRNVRVFPGGLIDRIMWVPANLRKSALIVESSNR